MTPETAHLLQSGVLLILLALTTAYTIRLLSRPPDIQLLRRIVEMEEQIKEFENCKDTLEKLESEIIALRGDNLRLMRIALTAASTAQQGRFQEAANASTAIAAIWQNELNAARQNLARLQAQNTTYGSNTPPTLTNEIEMTNRRITELESQLDLYHALNDRSTYGNQS